MIPLRKSDTCRLSSTNKKHKSIIRIVLKHSASALCIQFVVEITRMTSRLRIFHYIIMYTLTQNNTSTRDYCLNHLLFHVI